MFVYKFNDGPKFSCGIHSHVKSVYANLNTDEYITVLKKNRTNSFDVLYHNASCFDVHLHHNTFFGPLNIKRTAKVTAEHYAKQYIKSQNLFRIKFNPTTHAEKVHRKSVLFYTYYQTCYDNYGMDPEEYHELKNLFDYTKLYNASHQHLKIAYQLYTDTKKAYYDLFDIQLPWTNEIHNECSICIDNVLPHNGGHIPCGHSFHNKCIEKWITHKHTTCPNCRIEFNSQLFLI